MCLIYFCFQQLSIKLLIYLWFMCVYRLVKEVLQVDSCISLTICNVNDWISYLLANHKSATRNHMQKQQRNNHQLCKFQTTNIHTPWHWRLGVVLVMQQFDICSKCLNKGVQWQLNSFTSLIKKILAKSFYKKIN